MAKNFGDDRSKDKSLSSKIDGEEMDDIFTKDPVDFDDLVTNDRGDSKSVAKLTGKWGMEGVHGVSKGILAALNEELERNMPNVHVVKTEFSDTLDDIKELHDDISKQLAPISRQFQQIAKRVLPKAQGMMPESWYKNIMSKLEENAESSGPSKEEQQSDLIKSELEGIFSNQMETEKHRELEANKERLTDRLLGATRHKADMRALTRIYDSVRSTEIFHRTLHTAYMKKSLELKYKHLFVAQDTHNLLSNSLSTFEEYFRGIIKNTGLPDAVKMSASDYIKQSRTQRYGTLMSDYLSNARKMIFKNIKNSAKDTLEGLSMVASMADMADPEMLEMMIQDHGGLTGLGIRLGGWLAGRFGGEGAARGIMDKFKPWIQAGNGMLAGGKDSLYLAIDQLKRRMSQGGAISNWLSGFLPNISGISAITNDLLTKGEEPATFDKMTRTSIVEIIPGYLQKILHEAMMIRVGDENVPEVVYNKFERRFTTKGQYQDSIYNSPLLFDSKATQGRRVDMVMRAVTLGRQAKGEKTDAYGGLHDHMDTISKIISNHVIIGQPFDAEAINNFLNDGPTPDKLAANPYIRGICGNLEYGEFIGTLRTMMAGMTNKNGTINSEVERLINNQVASALKTGDTVKEFLPALREVFGESEIMADRLGTYYDTTVNGKTVRHTIIGGQRGLVSVDDINKGFMSDRLSVFDRGDIVDEDERMSDMTYKEMVTQYNAMIKAREQFKAAGDYINSSAAGKMAASIAGWFKDKFGSTIADGLKPIDELDGKPEGGIKGALKRGARNALNAIKDKQQKRREEEKAREVVYTGDPTRDLKVGSAAEGIIVERTAQILADRIAGPTYTGKQFDGLVAGSTAKSEEEPVVETSGGKKKRRRRRRKNKGGSSPEIPTQEGITHSVNAPDSRSILGRFGDAAKGWFGKGTDAVSEFYDKLPETPEEVDAQVKHLEEVMSDAWKNRPHNRAEAEAQIKSFMEDLAKKNPKLADRARRTYNSIINSKGYKAGDAYFEYARGKMSPYFSKAYSAGKKYYDSLMAKGTDLYKDLDAKSTERFNAFAKKHGLTLTRDILERALRGDADAKDILDKEMPELQKAAKEELAEDITGFLNKAKTGTMGAAESLGKGYKAAKGFFGDMWSRFKTGGDIQDRPEGERPSWDNDDLMGLLSAWKESSDRAHATIIDAIEHSMYTMAEASGNHGRNKDGTYISIKDFDRNKYGFFGMGGTLLGKTVGGLFKAGVWGAKTLGSIYAGTFGLGLKAAGGVIGGVRKVGGWAANSIGMNPYTDLYVSGQPKPILYAKQQYSGEVVYEDNGQVPKSTKEIIKRGVPLVSLKTEQYVVTEEEIRQGLWAKDGVLGTVIKAPFKLAGQFLSMEHTILKGYVGIATTVAKGLFGSGGEDPVVDVYLKDHVADGPLVTRRQQLKGTARFANGEKIEKSSDIHEPVYDFSANPPRMLVSKEDIETGLVNVRNKRIGTDVGSRGILGGLFGAGGALAKGVIGTGMKVLGGAFGVEFALLKALIGGAGAAGRGIAKLGARLFGFDTGKGFGSKAVKGVTDRLDIIINLMSKGYGIGVGASVGGAVPVGTVSPSGRVTTGASVVGTILGGGAATAAAAGRAVAGSKPASSAVKTKKMLFADKNGNKFYVDVPDSGDGDSEASTDDGSGSGIWNTVGAVTGLGGLGAAIKSGALKRIQNWTGITKAKNYAEGFFTEGAGSIKDRWKLAKATHASWKKSEAFRQQMARARASGLMTADELRLADGFWKDIGHGRLLNTKTGAIVKGKAAKAVREANEKFAKFAQPESRSAKEIINKLRKVRAKDVNKTLKMIKLSPRTRSFGKKAGWGALIGAGLTGLELLRMKADGKDIGWSDVGKATTDTGGTLASMYTAGKLAKGMTYIPKVGGAFNVGGSLGGGGALALAMAGTEAADWRKGALDLLDKKPEELTAEDIEAVNQAGLVNSLTFGLSSWGKSDQEYAQSYADAFSGAKDQDVYMLTRNGKTRLTNWTDSWAWGNNNMKWYNPLKTLAAAGHLGAGFVDATVDGAMNYYNVPAATVAASRAQDKAEEMGKELQLREDVIRARDLRFNKIIEDSGIELPDEYYFKTTVYPPDAYDSNGKLKPGRKPEHVAGEVDPGKFMRLYLKFYDETGAVEDPRAAYTKDNKYKWWANKNNVEKFQEWLTKKFSKKTDASAAASQRRLGAIVWPAGSKEPYASYTLGADLKKAIAEVKRSDVAERVMWPPRPEGLAAEFIAGFKSLKFFYEVMEGQKILGKYPVMDAWWAGLAADERHKGVIPPATKMVMSGMGVYGGVSAVSVDNPEYTVLKSKTFKDIQAYAEAVASAVDAEFDKAKENSKMLAYKPVEEETKNAVGSPSGTLLDKGVTVPSLLDPSGIGGLGLDLLSGFNVPSAETPKAEIAPEASKPTSQPVSPGTTTSTMQSGPRISSSSPRAADRVINDFIASIGGETAVRSMSYPEFTHKLRDYFRENWREYAGDITKRGAISNALGRDGEARWREITSAKRNTPDASIITAPDKGEKDTPTQDQLNEQKATYAAEAKQAQTRVSEEQQRSVEERVRVAEERNDELAKTLGQMVKNQERTNQILGNVVGKNGMKVAGMDTLSAAAVATATKPVGGSTQITNIIASRPIDEGINASAPVNA